MTTAVDVGIDVVSSVATATVQFGYPEPGVIVPTVAGSVLYSAGIKNYVEDNYGGTDGPLADSYARDVSAKTVLVALVSFVTNQFLGGDIDILDSVVNSFVTFSASNGIREALVIP